MADEILWYVRYADGKWKVQEAENATNDDIWIEARNVDNGPKIAGIVLADCENEATQKALEAILDILAEARKAPLPVRFD